MMGTVYALGYRYFNALMFWLPGRVRDRPYHKVSREVRAVLSRHADAQFSVVAHSFGTYLVVRLLRDNPDIKFHRIILCGTIVEQDFPWDELGPQITEGVINDCGTKDLWPIVAQSTTWGYGASGVFGFKSALVRDRFHPIDHGGCFQEEFVRTYWLPYLERGEIVERRGPRPEVGWWMPFVANLPLRWVIFFLLLVTILLTGNAGVNAWRDQQPVRLLASVEMRGVRNLALVTRSLRQHDILYHGDQFRVQVETQIPCWVYVFGVDEIGRVSGREPMKMVANQIRLIPSDSEWFSLSPPAGKETLYVLASRRRNAELDQAIATRSKFETSWLKHAENVLAAPDESNSSRVGTLSFRVGARSTNYVESQHRQLTGLRWDFENRMPP